MLFKQGEIKIDPRMKRTRQMLQRALMELMAEKTFQAITVHDIAERATVNRATFYDHFVDKFALLEYSIRESFEQDMRARMPEDARLSLGGLRTLVEIVCGFMYEGRRHCKPVDEQLLRLVESQTTAQVVEVMHVWLEQARRADAPEIVLAELTANMIGWAIFGAARHWLEDKNRAPAAEFAASLLPIITDSMRHSFHVEGLEPESVSARNDVSISHW